VASASAILERFGGVDIRNEINGTKIHDFTNILALAISVHTRFNALKLWLEHASYMMLNASAIH